jgi:DNA-binding NtrC family response regulator
VTLRTFIGFECVWPGELSHKRGFEDEHSRNIFARSGTKESMHDPSFQILYLGEDSAWSKISASANEAVQNHLKVHRAQSLNELFLILAGGTWHAAAIDIKAWKFQGLHYVDKIRSEYPAFPILALFPSPEGELAVKATNSGASRCLAVDQLTPDALQLAVLSCYSEKKSEAHSRKGPPMQLSYEMPNGSGISTKNQVISHALSNLLCVISANADVLAEHVGLSGPGGRSVSEIKKAAKSAADLMRLLK